MNFYNPYLPFAWAQSLDFQSAQPMMNLNTLLTTHLTSLMLASSDSLNAKREFTYQSDDELDFMSAVNYKKVKPCSEIPIANMLGQNFPSQKRDSKSKQSKGNYQHVIAVDENEDCSIIDNPSMKAHKDWNFEKGFDLGNHFSSLATQRRSTVEGQPSNSIFGKESEIIVIDNDEDQLTCDMTPLLKQDSLSICSDNSETQKSQTAETALKGGKKSIGDVSQFLHLANIPSFKLSALTRKRNKERKVKSVWKSSNFEPETFQRWTEQMEKAVGIQITNEEKVLKIIKSFDMNLEAALEKIKRNKAYYKDYFRVKKLNKNSTLLF